MVQQLINSQKNDDTVLLGGRDRLDIVETNQDPNTELIILDSLLYKGTLMIDSLYRYYTPPYK